MSRVLRSRKRKKGRTLGAVDVIDRARSWRSMPRWN